MQKSIKVIFFFVCLGIIASNSVQNLNAESSNKAKSMPRVAMNSEQGYYCAISGGDPVFQGSKISTLKQEAESIGYLSVEDYCKTLPESQARSPNLAVGQEVSINIRLKRNSDQRLLFSAMYNLPPGQYKYSFSCQSFNPKSYSYIEGVVEMYGIGYIPASIIDNNNIDTAKDTLTSYSSEVEFALEESAKNSRVRVRVQNCSKGIAVLKRIS